MGLRPSTLVTPHSKDNEKADALDVQTIYQTYTIAWKYEKKNSWNHLEMIGGQSSRMMRKVSIKETD